MNPPAEQSPVVVDANRTIAHSRKWQGLVVLGLAAVLVAGAFGYRGFRHARRIVLARAPVYSSAVTVGPGMIAEILVKPGQKVRKGELLAVMDFSQLEAAREAAEQNLVNAISASSTGNQAMAPALQPPSLGGSIIKKIVPVGKVPVRMPPVQTNNIKPLPPTGPSSANTKAPVASPTPPGPPATSTDANQADGKVKALQDKIKVEEDAVKQLQQAFAADQDQATAAQDLVNSLATVAARTKAESDKSATLLAEGVISANEAAKSQSYAQQASAQLEDAKVKAAADEAALGDTQRDIDKAAKQLADDQDGLKKAQVEAENARKALAETAARPQNPTSQQPPAMREQYKLVTVPGPVLPPAPAVPLQPDFLPPQLELQKIQMAEAQLDQLNRQFQNVCVYAPDDGVVTSVAIHPGQFVQANLVAVILRKQ